MRSLSWLSVLLVLGACALAPRQSALPDLAAIPAAFEMSGRIAVRNGQQNDIARLRWTHTRASDRWVIATPIGNEVARIQSDEGGATLEQAGGTPRHAASFQALTSELLGVSLEPAELAAWLHGAAPQAANGWTVTLDERQAAGAVEIARRVTATRGEVTVRLVVDDYRALAE
jgi:outer membrane biogenesis lipoprotein LolB